MPAELHPDVNPITGKARLRCGRCDKVAYADEVKAQEAAARISERTPMRAYFNKRCGWWHVTRKGAQPTMQLRDYQQAAVDFIFDYFHKHEGNPIVALPTGTGKSVVIGEFIKRAYTTYPGTRIMMLTHVKELIEQNMKNLLKVWPSAPAGVYSAGLKRRESHAPITFAGIQSVRKKAEWFDHIDMVLIDECHLVSPKDTTSYQTFLADLKKVNPKLKVIGFSATPYRLGQGMLTDTGGLFTDVCFDLTDRESFNWLIQQGWIAPLIPRKTQQELDVNHVRVQGGEYVLSDLQQAVDREAVTHAALKEAIALAEDRDHWLVFATGIEHAEHVAEMLDTLGVSAAVVHSKLSNEERDARINAFKQGRIRALVNNNVLTTGFDYPEIDCIVVLRPTASPVLWVQMLGRGTRPVYAPGMPTGTPTERLAAIAAGPKRNCLVLDFAGNTGRLGPVNDPVLPKKKGKGAPGAPPVRLCEACGCYSHASARFCENPDCGVEFPRAVKITAQASPFELIAGDLPPIETFKVDRVVYSIHHKEGKPDSMRVDYYCGLRKFNEYICLDHGGYARRVAEQWWRLRSPWGIPPSVHDGMKAIDFLRVPKQITVVMKPKYPEVSGYVFGDD